MISKTDFSMRRDTEGELTNSSKIVIEIHCHVRGSRLGEEGREEGGKGETRERERSGGGLRDWDGRRLCIYSSSE